MKPQDPPPQLRALIIGASGGIGAAFVAALSNDKTYAEVIGLSRSQDGLDLTKEASIERLADMQVGEFDLIICATGALEIDGQGPEKTIARLSPATMAQQFQVNAIGPALILKHFSPLLAQARRSVFAVLTARVGSIDDNRLGGWISYRAAKAAANQILRTSAIEITRKRPQSIVVALHPGTVETKLAARQANHLRIGFVIG